MAMMDELFDEVSALNVLLRKVSDDVFQKDELETNQQCLCGAGVLLVSAAQWTKERNGLSERTVKSILQVKEEQLPTREQAHPVSQKTPQEEVWDSVTKTVKKMLETNQEPHGAGNAEKHAVEEVIKLARAAANAAVTKHRTERERTARTRGFDQRQQAQAQSRLEGLRQAHQKLREQLLFLQIAQILQEDTASRPEKFRNLQKVGDQAIVLPFTKKKDLGKGGFGVVYSAVDKKGFEFAVKEVSRNGVEEDCLRKEVKILCTLAHENIVRCYGCAGDEEHIFMFIELMQGGSIDDEMERLDKPIAVNTASRYTKGLLNGLVYLHGKGIVHRDIKCANVLLDSAKNVKLADMGISKNHDQETLLQYEEQAGTLFWMSPEIISGKQAGKRSDVWAVGCTVYEMVKRNPPFLKELASQRLMIPILLPAFILKFAHLDLVKKDDGLGPSLQNFLSRIFVKMEDRPYAEKLAQHPWIR